MTFTGKEKERVFLTYHGIPSGCDRIKAFSLGSTMDWSWDISTANGLTTGQETYDVVNTTATNATSPTQTIYFNLEDHQKIIYAHGESTPGGDHDFGIAVEMNYYDYKAKLIMPCPHKGEGGPTVIEINKN